MRVALINPPNHECDVDDLAPPLGLLVLTEALMGAGFSVEVLDFNLLSCMEEVPWENDFYAFALDKIQKIEPSVACFTSMGINSHVSLEIARQLKEKCPSVITIFGGTHFSSIASEFKQNFPWVDYVLSGAGEHKLPELLLLLKQGLRPGFEFIGNTNQSEQEWHHPWSAYSKIVLSDYFNINPRHVLDFETGRGCKYKCHFCYSASHWREKTEFPVSQIIKDFKKATQVGAKHLFLVQDNFLNNRLGAASLCLRLADIPDKPTWNCYATIPDIDEEIPGFLARGGCISVYLGIDAVTTAQKFQFGKFFAKSLEHCIEKIKALVAVSVIPTCSFIMDPFAWSDDELEASFQWATRLRLEGANLSFHVLTHYNNTALEQHGDPRKLVPDDFRMRLMFDCPEVVVENPFAAKLPHLFPFHSRKMGSYELYKSSLALVYLGQMIISAYPYEIFDLVKAGKMHIVEILRKVYGQLNPEMLSSLEPQNVKLFSQLAFEEILRKSYGFVRVS